MILLACRLSERRSLVPVPGAAHKRFEQGALERVLGQALGVPLHCQPKGMANQLKRFQDAIWGAARGVETGRQPENGLVVHAVDLKSLYLHQGRHAAAALQGDRMRQMIALPAAGGEVIVLDGIGVLGLDIFV
jgi:hypothetical protein